MMELKDGDDLTRRIVKCQCNLMEKGMMKRAAVPCKVGNLQAEVILAPVFVLGVLAVGRS